MTNALLFFTLLFTPPVDNFCACDAAGRPSWYLTADLCLQGEFQTRLTATNGVYVIETRDRLAGPGNWYRLGLPITAPATNWQTLAIPAPATGPWYFRLRQLP
jgi:hypothetical protein